MLWKKLWLLFTVIWVVVSGLNAGTILAFSPDEREKALQPIVLAIAVPALLFLIGWAWQRLRGRQGPSEK